MFMGVETISNCRPGDTQLRRSTDSFEGWSRDKAAFSERHVTRFDAIADMVFGMHYDQ